jgi:hypothetical protein
MIDEFLEANIIVAECALIEIGEEKDISIQTPDFSTRQTILAVATAL